MYLTACKFLVTPVRRTVKKLAPVPGFQGTPVRLEHFLCTLHDVYNDAARLDGLFDHRKIGTV